MDGRPGIFGDYEDPLPEQVAEDGDAIFLRNELIK